VNCDGQWAERLGFDSRQGQDLSLFHSAQTDCEAHPDSYPVGAGSDLPGSKATGS
jgi:hypothetical protein